MTDIALSIAIGAVAASAVVFGTIYAMTQLRRRRVAAQGGPATGPEVASDRAFNRMAMARREADLLLAQGVDVGRARELLALADRSFQAREFDRAFELAQSSHETLVNLRRQHLGAARAPPRTAEPLSAAPPAAPLAHASPEPRPGPPPPAARDPVPLAGAAKLPKNKLESQFQLHLLENELAKKPVPPGHADASSLHDQAQAAFGREEYTDALRLALKGRRTLGGSVESLGPSGPAGTGAARAAPAGAGDSLAAAETVAGSERCARCGHPVTAGDTFCRGCGAPHTSASSCPNCGAARTPADAFCGKCGRQYS